MVGEGVAASLNYFVFIGMVSYLLHFIQTDVLVPLRNMSHDEKYFKNADQFIPERFLRGDKSIDDETRHTEPFVYLPFGFGPRSCIGQRFAENEMYIITAKVQLLKHGINYYSLQVQVISFYFYMYTYFYIQVYLQRIYLFLHARISSCKINISVLKFFLYII